MLILFLLKHLFVRLRTFSVVVDVRLFSVSPHLGKPSYFLLFQVERSWFASETLVVEALSSIHVVLL